MYFVTFQGEMLEKLKKYDKLLEVEVDLRYVLFYTYINRFVA